MTGGDRELLVEAKALALDVLNALVPEVFDPMRFEDPRAMAVMVASVGTVFDILRANAAPDVVGLAEQLYTELRAQVRDRLALRRVLTPGVK